MASDDLESVCCTFRSVSGIISCGGLVSESTLKALLVDLDPNLWTDDTTSQLFRSARMTCDGLIKIDRFIHWLACDSRIDRRTADLAKQHGYRSTENTTMRFEDCTENVARDLKHSVGLNASARDRKLTLKERSLEAMHDSEKLKEMGRELFSRVQSAPRKARRKYSEVDAVDFKQLEEFSKWFTKELESGDLLQDTHEFYAMLMVHDSRGQMVLTVEDFTSLLQDIFARLFGGAPTLVKRTPSQRLDAVEPVGSISVSVVTMDGNSCEIEVDDRETTSGLKKLVMSHLSIPMTQQRLACRGVILQDDVKLHDQGIVCGESLLVIRVRAPPRKIRFLDPSMRSGRATDGVYSVMNGVRSSDDRPIYHGGDMGLYFSFNQMTERWEFNDTRVWEEFPDRCWAFCRSNAFHPGELSDATWNVFGGMENGAVQYREAPSMKLVVEDDDAG